MGRKNKEGVEVDDRNEDYEYEDQNQTQMGKLIHSFATSFVLLMLT